MEPSIDSTKSPRRWVPLPRYADPAMSDATDPNPAHHRDPSGALVLFSGGQDSTTCLAWALSRFAHVETIGFDYRQRHRVELDCRAPIRASLRTEFPAWAPSLGEDHLVDLGLIGEISETALTRDVAIAIAANGL